MKETYHCPKCRTPMIVVYPRTGAVEGEAVAELAPRAPQGERSWPERDEEAIEAMRVEEWLCQRE